MVEEVLQKHKREAGTWNECKVDRTLQKSEHVPEVRAMRIWNMFLSGYQSPMLESL